MHYGHTYVGLKEIDKMNGHPTTLGMAQICEQILTNIDETRGCCTYMPQPLGSIPGLSSEGHFHAIFA